MSELDGRRYRFDHSGMEQGDHLLFCRSAYQLVTGYADFIEFTRLADDQVLSDPVVATPIPLYPELDGTGWPGAARPVGGRRWQNVSPEALWHPLFWIPEGVWRRRTMDELVEPDRVWAIRICLELQAANLYEPDLGWVDVLAEHGLHTEDPNDMARVLSWLNGQYDSILDTIDLTPRLLAPEPSQGGDDWALEAASGLVLNFQGRAWASIADELLGYIEEAEADPDNAASRAWSIVDLAEPMFAGIDVPDIEEVETFWDRITEQVESCEDDGRLIVGLLQPAKHWLVAVRAHYWPDLEALDELTASLANVTDRVS